MDVSRVPAPVKRVVHLGSRSYGRLTAPARMTPSFLICGGQRCGTTSLYRAMAGHPVVLKAVLHKGVHYFDTSYDRGMGWYKAHFPLRGNGKVLRQPKFDGELRSVGARGVRHHIVRTDCDGLGPGVIDRETPQVGAAVFCRDDYQAGTVAAPDDATASTGARRMLIAGEPALDIVVVAGGEIPRFGSWRQVHHVQIRLVVEPDRPRVLVAREGEALAVG